MKIMNKDGINLNFIFIAEQGIYVQALNLCAYANSVIIDTWLGTCNLYFK